MGDWEQPNRYATFCSFTADKLEFYNGANAGCSWLLSATWDLALVLSLAMGHTPYNSFYVVSGAFGYKPNPKQHQYLRELNVIWYSIMYA